MRNEYPNAVADQSIEFGFHGDNGVLELIMNQGSSSVDGWTLFPHKHPLTVSNEVINIDIVVLIYRLDRNTWTSLVVMMVSLHLLVV